MVFHPGAGSHRARLRRARRLASLGRARLQPPVLRQLVCRHAHAVCAWASTPPADRGFAGSRARAMLYNAALAIGAIVVVVLANVAMFRHDVYVDATREAANTPPPQFESVLDGLSSDVSLTYFYNHSDRNAIDAKDLLTVAARQNPHFHFSAVDIDKEPAKARAFGARAYNTAVVETDGRRVVVENTADLAQLAFATLRVLKKKVDVVCFVTGHGESVPVGPAHF